MKKTLIMTMFAVAIVSGCSRGTKTTMQREQQQYQVVQEGQAAGVTSTLGGPGETSTTPPIGTTTAVDTTTAMTLPVAGAATPQTGISGSMASGYPVGTPPPSGSGSLYAPAAPVRTAAPRPVTRTVETQRTTVTQQAQPPVTYTPMASSAPPPQSQQQQPQQPPQQQHAQPAPTDTNAATAQPHNDGTQPAADGNAPQQQQQQPKPKQDEKPKSDAKPKDQPSTDTAPPADQPPPTQTDTQGQ